MTQYTVIPGPPGEYLDVDGNPSAAECLAIKAAGYVGLIPYVPFAGLHDTSSCVTRATIDNALAADLVVFFVQHVRGLPPDFHWRVANCSGAADGQAAMGWLRGIDASLCDATCAQDIEAVTGTGDETFAFCKDYGDNVNEPGFYDGFDNPMTAEQKYDLPRVRVYWNAPGVRHVAKRGYLIQQGRTITIAGRQYDVDTVKPTDDLAQNNLKVIARVIAPDVS
jgi:hypothetical protein